MESSVATPIHEKPSKTVQVRDHFGSTSPYLSHAYNIRIRADIVRRLVGTAAGAAVLDVGCGDGSISHQFLASSRGVTFVDFAPAMIQAVERGMPSHLRSKAAIFEGDFMSLDFGARKYDLILCLGVLAHVDSVESTIQRLASLLKPLGRCVYQFTDRARLTSRLFHWYAVASYAVRTTVPYRMNVTTLNGVTAYAEAAGLNLRSFTRYSLLLPGMRRLPGSWVYEYQRYTAQSALLSTLCTDVIAVYERPCCNMLL